MKKLILTITILSTCFLGIDPVWGQEKGDFGFGFQVGEPMAFTGKYWLSSKNAIDGALGFPLEDGADFSIHGDYLWHWDTRVSQSDPLLFYLGLGLRVRTLDKGKKKGDSADAGFRFPFGLDFFPKKVPLEIFGEFVPVLIFAGDTGFDLDGAVGVRYKF